MTYSKTGTMQEQLMLSNNKQTLSRLLEAYQQAIDFNMICSMTDDKGTIIYANKKFCEISQYTQEELLGQNHNILNSGYHTKEFFKELWETIKAGKTWRNDVKNRAKDGSYYWVDTVVLPIYGEDNSITKYFSLRMPITDKKKLEEEQKLYIKTLHEMLHLISHKVRKPIASCLGLINLFDLEHPMKQEEITHILSHLKSNAMELDIFIKELTHLVYDMEQKAHEKNLS